MPEKPSDGQSEIQGFIANDHRTVNPMVIFRRFLNIRLDCRNILKSLDIPWNRVENRLNENSAFENNRERLVCMR